MSPPLQGGDIEWVSKQVIRGLREFRIRGDVVVRKDQEPLLGELVRQFCVTWS